jgi:apolipoprotein N-acyltransferase
VSLHPLRLGFLSFVSLVPFFSAVQAELEIGGRRSVRGQLKRGFQFGYVLGISMFLILFYWILFLSSDQVTIPGLMIPALCLMVLYLSLYTGLFGACFLFVYARRRALGIVAAGALWTFAELLKARGVLGFPWGSLGYAVAEHPVLIQFASITSVAGLSFWIVIINYLCWLSVSSLRWRGRLAYAGVALLLFTAVFVHGVVTLSRGTYRDSMRVGIMQPNIDPKSKWDPKLKDAHMQKYVEMTRALSQCDPELVIWPETAAPSFLRHHPRYQWMVREAAISDSVPILVGYPDWEPVGDGYKYYNAAGLIDPHGRWQDEYAKMHLVPFSEALPFEERFEVLRNINLGQADFSAGTEYTLFEVQSMRFGVLICFESIFPELAREFVERGADFLVNITNDGWFGRTAGPLQHASMAVLRAVENRVPIARCANTGVSMIIDPYGRVIEERGLFLTGRICADMPMCRKGTFYTRHGQIIDLIPAILAILVVVAAVPRKEGKESL